MRQIRRIGSVSSAFWPFLLAGRILTTTSAQADQTIYTDSLQNQWQPWGWTQIDYGNTNPVHSGTLAISVSITNGWQAIFLGHDAFDSTPYTNLSLWINGGASGGQQLNVQGHAGGAAQTATNLPVLAANAWQQFVIPLAALGCANRPDMDGFWIQDAAGKAQPTFYLDDIGLLSSGVPPVTNMAVTITVDAQLNRHPISPLIYGVAFASSNQLLDLNFTLNRSGGNSETRNNWLLNAHNHAADWYFESLDDPSGASLAPGGTADAFVADSKNGGAQPMLTIPFIGWAPKLGPNRGKLASYSISKYGLQTSTDQWMPDAGNGIGTNPATHATWLISTNDPADANFPTNSGFQAAWIQHLTNRWGWATNGGVAYYLMDNEHSIWHATHRDVHPVGATMQEIRDKLFDYAAVVKSLDPNALVLGPEEWGWSGYFFSGYDQQHPGYHDRANNGGWDYCPWLLAQCYQRETNTHQRLLDYFTLHCYPQGGESSGDVSLATQLLRNRSTRQLWDTNYVDASWIGSQPANNILMLIPRMKNWVAEYYPGTRTGITEYNWGGEGNINGATAQADVLGIFGREGLDLATRWTAVATNDIVHKAMKMYRNYDGNRSTFGDLSVAAIVPNPDNVSAFAALRSADNALTLMVINKQPGLSATASVVITNRLLNGKAQVWQLTASNVITRLSDISFTGSAFTNTVPAQSITLFVLPSGTPPPAPRLRPGTANSNGRLDMWLDGTVGQRYVLDSSSNLLNWEPLQTNTLTNSSWYINPPVANGPQNFYRGRWMP